MGFLMESLANMLWTMKENGWDQCVIGICTEYHICMNNNKRKIHSVATNIFLWYVLIHGSIVVLFYLHQPILSHSVFGVPFIVLQINVNSWGNTTLQYASGTGIHQGTLSGCSFVDTMYWAFIKQHEVHLSRKKRCNKQWHSPSSWTMTGLYKRTWAKLLSIPTGNLI